MQSKETARKESRGLDMKRVYASLFWRVLVYLRPALVAGRSEETGTYPVLCILHHQVDQTSSLFSDVENCAILHAKSGRQSDSP